MITGRTVRFTGDSLLITVTYAKNEEEEKHSKEEAGRQESIGRKIKPVITSKMAKLLRNTWGPSRPSDLTLKDIKVNFLTMANPRIWWSEEGLNILESCDAQKEHFITELANCSHYGELENICRDFAREVLQWIAKLKHYPATTKNYSKEVQEATIQEIVDRENTIKVARPLARLAKIPTEKSIQRLRIMFRQLWTIRFIHIDEKRPCEKLLKSVCVETNNLVCKYDRNCYTQRTPRKQRQKKRRNYPNDKNRRQLQLH